MRRVWITDEVDQTGGFMAHGHGILSTSLTMPLALASRSAALILFLVGG